MYDHCFCREPEPEPVVEPEPEPEPERAAGEPAVETLVNGEKEPEPEGAAGRLLSHCSILADSPLPRCRRGSIHAAAAGDEDLMISPWSVLQHAILSLDPESSSSYGGSTMLPFSMSRTGLFMSCLCKPCLGVTFSTQIFLERENFFISFCTIRITISSVPLFFWF